MNRPTLKRSELPASTSLNPIPVSTCEASGLSAAQAEPAETATSRSSKPQALAVDAGESGVQDVGGAPGRVAVLRAAPAIDAQLLPQPIAQRRETRRLALGVRELVGLAHADDLMRGQRAGA